MAKTQQIAFYAASVNTSTSTLSPHIFVEASSPDVMDLLSDIEKKDIVDFINGHFSPDEVFPQKDLEKWAESEGYTKNNE